MAMEKLPKSEQSSLVLLEAILFLLEDLKAKLANAIMTCPGTSGGGAGEGAIKPG